MTGIVQGVGFRPSVFALADELGLVGWVRNDAAGVTIEVQGAFGDLELFGIRLRSHAPPMAVIDDVTVRDVATVEAAGFVIQASTSEAPATTLVSPDIATCAECLREIRDPPDRRHAYAFTNCTNCGPRYSIIDDIPYDRHNTTMRPFLMCATCRNEYDDPRNRRFHAQPVCCPTCGPQLSDGVAAVADRLRSGEVVAVKGLGGYHLMVIAANESAVSRLRNRKQREDKPFAVMVGDLEGARALCEVSADEATVLESLARPIVLLTRRSEARLADAVAPGNRELGVMLAYTPLHHLLLDELDEPIVCTSANLSDEPIAYQDDDARSRLGGIADSFLTHDRDIRIRIDDSVVRLVDDAIYPIRRSRGYAPAPLRVAWTAPREVLALGADLKNTIALARRDQVFVSHHIGDLHSTRTHEAFVEAIGHLCKLFEIEPSVVAYDQHPQYRSSAFGADLAELDQVPVQHHHAHIAACLSDAAFSGPVIGVAFDGMGYGDDGTIWGGEFLEADLVTYRRRAWFSPVPLPGGDTATREPWRMAASYAHVIDPSRSGGLAVAGRHEQWDALVQIVRTPGTCPTTSSVGRLFDAVAALIGVRDIARYEGQAAIELEQAADLGSSGAYSARMDERREGLVVMGQDLFEDALDDLERQTPPSVISARFHRGLAATVITTCSAIRDQTALDTVALTGGVFLNTVLLKAVILGLRSAGFTVLTHRRVPCNDGGISLGQAAVAAAQGQSSPIVPGPLSASRAIRS